VRALLVACAVALAATPEAFADSATPWADGVAKPEQTIALDLYRAGNDEFVQSRYSQALVKYREAITHWDHPAIRYNMAVCLIEMNETLEAYEHLEAALRYGEAPFDAEKYEKGVAFREQLLAKLGHVEVTCSTEKARVSLDGQLLLECPGNLRRVVLPGRHEIVARREGFLTYTEDVEAVAGGTHAVTVKLDAIDVDKPIVAKTVTPARRDRIGLFVIVAGAALGAAALGYDLWAVQPARDRLTVSSEAYDAGVTTFQGRRNFDVALFVTAGAAIGTGLILHFRRADRTVVVAPTAGQGTAMVTVQWR
jgi:hypothetical protein